jgi:TonB family protein
MRRYFRPTGVIRLASVETAAQSRIFASFLFTSLCVLGIAGSASAVDRIAILNLGETITARRAAMALRSRLALDGSLRLIDTDQSAAAARGAGYTGSLNMSVDEARNLGSAIDCDFFITGDAQTIRRSASNRPVYYEAYASLFIVNARTGRLANWYRPRQEKDGPDEAEHALIMELEQTAPSYIQSIKRAAEADHATRLSADDPAGLKYEEAPEDEKAAAEKGIRLPQPYRRLRPVYPRSAAEANAEGSVDLLVDIGADGEVAGVDVVRWAGFGLDDAAIATVRQLHFRPAMRSRVPVPMRVLLRYNFRRPPKEDPNAEAESR